MGRLRFFIVVEIKAGREQVMKKRVDVAAATPEFFFFTPEEEEEGEEKFRAAYPAVLRNQLNRERWAGFVIRAVFLFVFF